MQEKGSVNWIKYAVYSLIVIIVLLLILILFLYLIKSPLIFRSGASTLTPVATNVETPATLSIDNSYIFASPLQAKVGGEKIRITVFVLDSRGLGIAGKKVTVGGGASLQTTPIQSVTDAQGRATFDILSGNSPGTYIIQAAVDGVNLVQTATISFD